MAHVTAAGPDEFRPSPHDVVNVRELAGRQDHEAAQQGQEPKHFTGSVCNSPRGHRGGRMTLHLGSRDVLEGKHGRQGHADQASPAPDSDLISQQVPHPSFPPPHRLLVQRKDLANVRKLDRLPADHAGDRTDERSHAPAFVPRIVREAGVGDASHAGDRRECRQGWPVDRLVGHRAKLQKAREDGNPRVPTDKEQAHESQVAKNEKDLRHHHFFDGVIDLAAEDQRQERRREHAIGNRP